LTTSDRKNKKTTRKKPRDREQGAQEPRYPEAASHTLSTLEQVKALANPLRIRLLETFCQERTTKQVADLIGERPTRLYHHVEALEKVGLIRQTRTRQNRGTIEKYFLAVARSFKADNSLFGRMKTEPEVDESVRSVVASVFDQTRGEMDELMVDGDMAKIMEDDGILTYMEIHHNDAFMAKLHKRLKRLLTDLQKECARDLEEHNKKIRAGKSRDDIPPDRRYRLTLAFFPLDRNKTG